MNSGSRLVIAAAIAAPTFGAILSRVIEPGEHFRTEFN